MSHRGNSDITTNHNSFTVRWCWTLKDIHKVLDELNGDANTVHICSGSSGIGSIRLDRYPIEGKRLHPQGGSSKTAGSPNIIGDMFHLPFKNSSIKTVIIDPPYDPRWIEDHVYRLMLDELLRVLKPAGKLIIISSLIFCHALLTVKRIDVYPTGKNNYYYKNMSVYQKNDSQLSDF